MINKIILLVIGVVIGMLIQHPISRRDGFELGAEWAIVQASIVAKESGVNMPVTYNGKEFKIILNRPKHYFRSVYMLAKHVEEEK
jgi:hypothetical protein